jgi:hypothetical protein
MCATGEMIEFDGVPGLSLLPLDDEARAAKLASIKRNWRSTSGIAYHREALKLAQSLGGGTFDEIDDVHSFVDNWIQQQEA